MATKKKTSTKKKSSGGKKGRVKPNVPRAGLSPVTGSRYCSGGKKR